MKAQLEERENKKYATFKAVEFRSQVVAGRNYFIKVSVSHAGQGAGRVAWALVGSWRLMTRRDPPTLPRASCHAGWPSRGGGGEVTGPACPSPAFPPPPHHPSLQVQVDDDEFVHLRVFQSLPHENKPLALSSYQTNKARHDELAYF